MTASPNPSPTQSRSTKPNLSDYSIGELIAGLRPGQLWGFIAASGTLLTLAFGAGARWQGYEQAAVQADIQRKVESAQQAAAVAERDLATSQANLAASQRAIATANSQRDAAKAEAQRLRGQIDGARQRAASSDQGRVKTESQPLRNALPARWQEYEGFADLIGRWEGKIMNGPGVEVNVPYTDSEDVMMSVNLLGTNCSVSAKLARATEMFAASEFYFKPATITTGCPEVQYLIVTPVLNSMRWELVSEPGSSLHAALKRRI